MNTEKISGKRILVVEDEMMVAMLLEDTLSDFGCIVVGPAARCDQAIELVKGAAQIDAAVLDVNLAGERSFPIADALIARGIPFVFATGYGSAGIAPEYSKCRVIMKPFDPSVLSEALSALVV